jgi:hypothetical protein
MSPISSPVSAVSAVILTCLLFVATSGFVISANYKISKINFHNRANHRAMFNHGSFCRLFTPYDVRKEISTEPKSNENGSQSNFYGTSDTETSEESTVDMNLTEYEVKNGSDYTDVANTEFVTTRSTPNLSPDQIIDVPRRRCPDGQKMDPFGKCKTVWNM